MQIDQHVLFYDDRRNIAIPGTTPETIDYCTEHFIEKANLYIKKYGVFNVALSGGSTPKKIFQSLSSEQYRNLIDWSKVHLFWSDERSVGPEDPQSNYHMAMEAGFNSLPIPQENIWRMKGEKEIEEAALEYEEVLQEQLPDGTFDMVMLGMGEDGHTASLFPKTHGLHAQERLVVANYVPQQETWRLTLTYPCINRANEIVIYVLGETKAEMVHQVLTSPDDPDHLPIQKIGTPENKALWILDRGAGKIVKTDLSS